MKMRDSEGKKWLVAMAISEFLWAKILLDVQSVLHCMIDLIFCDWAEMFQIDAWEAESQGPQTLSIGIENLWDSCEVGEEEFFFVCESSLWFLFCVTKFPMQFDWALFQEMNLGSWPSVLEKVLPYVVPR